MANIKYANVVPVSDTWRGMMTLPRTVDVEYEDGKYKIVQKPVKELDGYKKTAAYFEDITVDEAKKFEFEMENGAKEINISGINGNGNFSIVFKNLMGQKNVIEYNGFSNKIIFNRDFAGKADYHKNVKGNQEALAGKLDNIKIIIDKCSIEIFVNDGECVFTNVYFTDEELNQIIISSDKMLEIDGMKIEKIIL